METFIIPLAVSVLAGFAVLWLVPNDAVLTRADDNPEPDTWTITNSSPYVALIRSVEMRAIGEPVPIDNHLAYSDFTLDFRRTDHGRDWDRWGRQ